MPALLLLLMPPHLWARYNPRPCKNAFTEQQEITEGQKAAQEVFKQMPVLPDSDPVSRYVQQLGMRLVAYAPGYKWPYNFHVVNVEDINAFALPGGSIFVNLGTIQAAETEAQLAGVMAHEISHVAQRHSTCNITKQQMPSLLAGLGQMAAGIALGGAAGAMVQQGIGLTAGLSFLRMSRESEKQADLMGTDILYDAGYDPRALPQFFEVIQGKSGEGGAQFLSDHPNPGNRVGYVNDEIDTLPPRASYKKTSAEFTRIKKIVAGMHPYTAKQVASGVWKQQGGSAPAPSSLSAAPADRIPMDAAGQLADPRRGRLHRLLSRKLEGGRFRCISACRAPRRHRSTGRGRLRHAERTLPTTAAGRNRRRDGSTGRTTEAAEPAAEPGRGLGRSGEPGARAVARSDQ